MSTFRVGLLAAFLSLGLVNLGCDRVQKEMSSKPDIKIIAKGQETTFIADSECWAEVRNAGAAGYVTFTYTQDDGYKCTHRTYFDRDEKRTVRFSLPGASSLNANTWRLSVKANCEPTADGSLFTDS
jgi:hypothetical protein